MINTPFIKIFAIMADEITIDDDFLKVIEFLIKNGIVKIK